ncbi:Panacea domain-containing protein [Methylobacterium phyllostachyos]|uniref:Panacea domain-containing protein n=1 Tax=Methylobacterium phyllostachyos TaxID=582672 RepID=UPI000B83E501
MPNHSPKGIANEFLRRRSAFGLPAQMWIQKLVYIAHGWNLAINGQPLVVENAEAWDGGPVYRSIWNHIKRYGFGRSSKLLEDPETSKPIAAHLSVDEQAIIDLVWDKYNGFSGSELSRMTHQPGTPWTETYVKLGRDSDIQDSLIRRHYLDLARAGRAH